VRTLDNCWLSPDDYNAVEAMPGFRKFASLGTTPFRTARGVHIGIDETTSFLEKVYCSGAPDAAPTTTVFYRAQGSGYTSLKAGLADEAPIRTAQIANYLCCVNGNDAPFQIDLSDDSVSDMGATRPDSTNASTSLSGFSGGNVKGVVKYWLSIVTGTTEGALSAEFGEIDCKDGNQVVIDISHADFPGATKYNIYRTLANGTQPFLLFSSVAGGTTYNDNVPDDGGKEYEPLSILPYLHGDPPPSDLITIVEQFGRLWGLTEDGRLFWSDLINHESWWTTSDGNWTYIGRGDGDRGTALMKSSTGLYVFKDHHTYHVYTQDLDQMQVTPLSLATAANRSIGTLSQESVTSTREGIAFWFDENVYSLVGSEIRSISDAVAADFAGATASPTSALGYDSLRNHLWVSASLQGVHDSKTDFSYIYDFKRREWIGRYLYKFQAFAEYSGNFFLGVGGVGSVEQDEDVHVLYNGTDDSNGDVIACRCELSELVGSSPATDKLFLDVSVLLQRESSGTVTLEAIFDGDDTNSVDTSVALSEAGSTQDRIKRVVNLQERGREMALAITSTSASPQWKVFLVAPEWHEYSQTAAMG